MTLVSNAPLPTRLHIEISTAWAKSLWRLAQLTHYSRRFCPPYDCRERRTYVQRAIARVRKIHQRFAGNLGGSFRQPAPHGNGKAAARAVRQEREPARAFGALAVDRRTQESAALCRSAIRLRHQRGRARAGTKGQRSRPCRCLGALWRARRLGESRTL